MYHLISFCFAVIAVADSGNVYIKCTCVLWCIYSKVVAATTEPDSLNVSLNSIATFTCSSFGANFIFFTIDEVPVTEGVNADRGLNEGIQSVINGTRYRNLTVEAKVINNNTNISCTSVIGSDVTESEPALLRIQGNKQCNVSIWLLLTR